MTSEHINVAALSAPLSHAPLSDPVRQLERHTQFVWEGLRLVQEREGEAGSRTYVYDPKRAYAPLARVDRSASHAKGVTHYYHTDAAGTVRDVTDAQGRLVWSGRYTAWGAVQANLAQGESFVQALRMPGQYWDEESGLHYNTFRYYDPHAGQFISQDPIGLAGGLNLYAYAPNPFGWIDPLGLTEEGVFIHYTDQAGLNNILKTGAINPNSSGKVYLTDILMTPGDVERDIFIGNERYAGRGDYAVIFKATDEQMANIRQSSLLEYIHEGKMNIGEVLHAGQNPYAGLSGMSYEERLGMTHRQINARGGGCP
ncbi:RHS protein [Caballeronia temeraria]|uniref:RHS protein n=1 Tax=Caballeronia temeraria TaxID=1777137 RepID=A0A158AA05_9BURK|nr:RHS repeat-associated core domain-containing protein [Caballeronia temeraria]SAK54672.1 RHS protein [Caballeronia temeraria]